MHLGPMVAIAWRNLWRQRRRTILTLASIALGGFLAVLMTSMQDRSFADFIDNAARFGAGHVVFQHPEHRDRPTLSRTVRDGDRLRDLAVGDPRVTAVVERVTGQAMVSTAQDSFGGFFVAFDPARETRDTFRLGEGLATGAMFTRADEPGIVLGHLLAENLGAQLGDRIVFTLTDRAGEIVTGMERLSGTVTTGATSTDAGLMLLPIDRLRAVAGLAPDESTQVGVFVRDGRRAPRVAAALRAQVTGDVAVLTWDEAQPEVKAFVAMKIGGGIVFELVIAVLVAAGIFNTIFMSVLERTREFGIMLAIGYTPGQLFVMVMAESGFLAILGLAASAIVTAGPYWYLHETGIDMSAVYAQQGGIDIGGIGMDPILRIGIYPENALIIAAAIALATMLAGLYPAWRAGRVDPVAAINEG
jgi:ABC-type lipoprotein release transport system permease subunit